MARCVNAIAASARASRRASPDVSSPGSAIPAPPERAVLGSVLLVDDDERLCAMVAQYLRGQGFAVAVAATSS